MGRVGPYELTTMIGPRRSLLDADSGAECAITDWRHTPLATNPTPFEDFAVTEPTYYTTQVLGATWPAFIGLAAFVCLLLAFVLWRLVRLCCACCRRRAASAPAPFVSDGEEARGSSSRVKPLPRRQLLQPSRLFTVVKWLELAMCLGVMAGCMYGMFKVDDQLVDQGLAAVGAVTSFVNGGLSTASATVAAVEGIDAALLNVQGIVDSDINATDVTANLECLRPWLSGLPDPAPLLTSLEETAALSAQLVLALEAVAGNLSILAQPPPGGGDVAPGALLSLLDAQPVLEELQAQQAAFAAAAASSRLNASVISVAAMTAARDALSELMTNPAMSEKLAAIDTTADAAEAVKAAVNDAEAALTQALTYFDSLLNGPAAALEAELTAQTNAYLAVRPCMVALFVRVQHINGSVLVLPQDLEGYLSAVDGIRSKLDAALGVGADAGDTSAARLTASLDQAAVALEEAGAMAEQLADAKDQLAGINVEALAGGMRTYSASWQASQGGLLSLLDSMNAYVNSPNPISYLLLVPRVQTAGTATGTSASSLQLMLISMAPLYLEIQDIYDTLSTEDATGQVEALVQQIQRLPALDEFAAPLDAYAAQLAQLPTPRDALLDDAASALQDVVGAVSQTILDARAALSDVLSGASNTIADVRVQTVDKVDQYQEQYEPEVRKYDAIRRAVLYSLFGLLLALSLLLLAAACLAWPAGLKATIVSVLVLMTVCFALVVALTAGLKVGNDACTNLELQIEAEVSDPTSLRLLRYYLHNERPDGSPAGPGEASAILGEVLDVDVDAALNQVADARTQLEEGVRGGFTLGPLLQEEVDAAVALSYNVEDGIAQVLELVDYTEVHPVYLTAKSFPCCTVLNLVGGVWTGIIIAGTFAFAQCIASMTLIGALDMMPVNGCCGRYVPAPHSGPGRSRRLGKATSSKDGTGRVDIAVSTASTPRY